MNAKTAMSLFIVVIMILSVIGFVLIDAGTNETSRTFGKYKFYRTSQGWRANVNGQQTYFNYLPDQVNTISVDDAAKGILTSSPILGVTYDPNDRRAQTLGELQFYLEQVLNQHQRVFILRGLTNNSAYPALPELSCTNASQQLPVLVMEVSNKTQLVSSGWCVHAQASTAQELFLLIDRIVYTVLGVL